MTQYISKSALVAWAKETYLCENASMIRKVCYKQLLEHLDTLEVKEVNLNEEINNYFNRISHFGKIHLTPEYDNIKVSTMTIDGFASIAKHFFELGMAVSNKAQNIWHDASEKLPTGVIVVSNGGNLHIGWATEEGDGIEDEHGCLITKTYQKWAREKDLT